MSFFSLPKKTQVVSQLVGVATAKDTSLCMSETGNVALPALHSLLSVNSSGQKTPSFSKDLYLSWETVMYTITPYHKLLKPGVVDLRGVLVLGH